MHKQHSSVLDLEGPNYETKTGFGWDRMIQPALKRLATQSKLYGQVIRWDINSSDFEGTTILLTRCAEISGKAVRTSVQAHFEVQPVKNHFKCYAMMAEQIRDKPGQVLTREEAQKRFDSEEISQIASIRLAEFIAAIKTVGYDLCQLHPSLLTKLPGGVNLRFEMGIPIMTDKGLVFFAPAFDPIVFGLIKTAGDFAGYISPYVVAADSVLRQYPHGMAWSKYDFLTGQPSFDRLMRTESFLKLL